MVGAGGANHFPAIPTSEIHGEVMNQDTPETVKILGLYRKLSCALGLVETDGEADEGGDDALLSLATKLRELSFELEQLLDSEEEEGRGADFDLASKIRVIEREISVVLAAVRSCVSRTRDRTGQFL